jgi:MscS family membrane protein
MDRIPPSGIGTRIRRLALALALLCCASAGATTLLPELDTSSPAATLRSFLEEEPRMLAAYRAFRAAPTTSAELAVAELLLRAGSQLFDLRDLPPATQDKAGTAAVAHLADILARLPPIPLETVPGGPGWQGGALPARWTIPNTEIRIVRLAEGPRAGDYVFSADTVARLPAFYARIADQPVIQPGATGNWVVTQRRATGPWLAPLGLEDLPGALHATVFDTPIWKVLLSLAVGAAILAIVVVWRRIAYRRAASLAPWRARALILTVPVLLAALVLAGHAFITLEVIPASDFALGETTVAIALLYLAAAAGAWHACWLLAELVIASPAFPDSTYDAHLVRIVARVASVFCAVFIVFYGANDIGVPAVGLLAGVSIGGIALALAAQSTAANLLGGLSIFADRPFRVGEVIRFGAHSGKVEDIGPRSTRIRGADGTLTTVPNGDLINAQLVNLSARPTTLFQHRISLPPGLSSKQVETLLGDLRRRVEAHPLTLRGSDQPRVRLAALGASTGAMEVEVFAPLATTVTAEFLEAQEALLLDILRAVEDCVALAQGAAPVVSAPSASRSVAGRYPCA